jgi:type III pantothenate kinase
MAHPLLFDVGNTEVKVLDTSNQESFRFNREEFRAFLEERPERMLFGYASGDKLIFEGLKNVIRFVSTLDKAPLKSSYASMDTLGTDRWALCNAYFLEGVESFLLVTMGTCITYNVVKNGEFLGGAISPGWDMRYAAMNMLTAGLPMSKYSPEAGLLGTSTMGSLSAGVDVAIQKELEAMIADYSSSFQLNHVLICGGHSGRLSNPLKNYIFAPVNYELHALGRLYEYYAENGTL